MKLGILPGYDESRPHWQQVLPGNEQTDENGNRNEELKPKLDPKLCNGKLDFGASDYHSGSIMKRCLKCGHGELVNAIAYANGRYDYATCGQPFTIYDGAGRIRNDEISNRLKMNPELAVEDVEKSIVDPVEPLPLQQNCDWCGDSTDISFGLEPIPETYEKVCEKCFKKYNDAQSAVAAVKTIEDEEPLSPRVCIQCHERCDRFLNERDFKCEFCGYENDTVVRELEVDVVDPVRVKSQSEIIAEQELRIAELEGQLKRQLEDSETWVINVRNANAESQKVYGDERMRQILNGTDGKTFDENLLRVLVKWIPLLAVLISAIVFWYILPRFVQRESTRNQIEASPKEKSN